MLEKHLEMQNQRIAEISNVQQHMLEKLMDLLKDKGPEVNDEISSNLERNSLLKLEFLSFDGINPRNWVKKCSTYFSLCKILESQRVDVASMHFVGELRHGLQVILQSRNM